MFIPDVGHIFISYSRRDEVVMQRVVLFLRKRGFKVWVDNEKLKPGTSAWEAEIEQAIPKSFAIVVLLSPDAKKSEWVRREITLADQNQVRIYPLLVRGSEQNAIFLRLIASQYTDIQGEKEEEGLNSICVALESYFNELVEQKRDQEAAAKLEGEQKNPEIVKPEERQTKNIKADPDEEKFNQAKTLFARLNWNSQKTILSLVLLVFVLGAVFGLPKIFQGASSAASETPTHTQATATSTSTKTPVVVSETALPAATSTAVNTPTLTPIPSPYPSEIVDGYDVAMMHVPAGEFTMGSNFFEEEQPIHSVYLDDYYIDKFEVTNSLYRDCVDAEICDPPWVTFSTLHPDYYSAPEFDNYPVIFVDWDMAVTYCETWRGLQLPTEAQWEKAARGPDARKYPWGETLDCSHSNFWAAGGSACVGDTTTVGSYEIGVSPYGVYDMSGNVWEWVADSYNGVYYGSLPDGFANPTGPAQNLNAIIIRGGGWDSGVNGARSAYRGYLSYAYYANNLGFRCAKDIP